MPTGPKSSSLAGLPAKPQSSGEYDRSAGGSARENQRDAPRNFDRSFDSSRSHDQPFHERGSLSLAARLSQSNMQAQGGGGPSVPQKRVADEGGREQDRPFKIQRPVRIAHGPGGGGGTFGAAIHEAGMRGRRGDQRRDNEQGRMGF